MALSAAPAANNFHFFFHTDDASAFLHKFIMQTEIDLISFRFQLRINRLEKY